MGKDKLNQNDKVLDRPKVQVNKAKQGCTEKSEHEEPARGSALGESEKDFEKFFKMIAHSGKSDGQTDNNWAKPIRIVRDYRGAALSAYFSDLKTRLKENQGNLFTELQKEVLVGVLLGDGSLQKNAGINAHFKYDQGWHRPTNGDPDFINKESVDFLYFLFQDFTGTPPQIRFRAGREHSYWFRTYRHPCFSFYENQFYQLDNQNNRRKVIPKLLHRWLSPISLAFWYMDDGSKEKNGSYRLHTQGFTRSECRILQGILGERFHIESQVAPDHKSTSGLTYYRLDIPTGKNNINSKKFTCLIQRFVLPSMKYKLHKDDTPRHEVLCGLSI
jgi:hypothetical protein